MTSLTGSETLEVRGNYTSGKPSGVTETVTTQQIANLGGGGSGITHERDITSGTADTAPLVNTICLWDSATTGNKTQTIPTSSGSLGIIIIMDVEGNASTYPITAVPSSGSIIGPNSVYINNASITLIDTSLGWMST